MNPDADAPLILLVANNDKPGAATLAGAAARRLEALGAATKLVEDRDAPINVDGVRLAVVFGGDGTVLNALRRLGDTPPPLLGVNLGRLGFLSAVPPDKLDDILPAALAGELPHTERIRLSVVLRRGGQARWRGLAVNEALVHSGRTGRITRLEAQIDGERVMSFAGDGLLAATPTGSTAHSLSAGGPVLGGCVRAMALVPVCAHRLSLRALVAGPDETITIRTLTDETERLSVDGAAPQEFKPGDELSVRVAAGGWRLLSPNGTRYAVLRGKLGWDEGGDGERVPIAIRNPQS